MYAMWGDAEYLGPARCSRRDRVLRGRCLYCMLVTGDTRDETTRHAHLDCPLAVSVLDMIYRVAMHISATNAHTTAALAALSPAQLVDAHRRELITGLRIGDVSRSVATPPSQDDAFTNLIAETHAALVRHLAGCAGAGRSTTHPPPRYSVHLAIECSPQARQRVYYGGRHWRCHPHEEHRYGARAAAPLRPPPWRPAVYRVNDGAVSVSMGSYPRTRPLSLRAANSPARILRSTDDFGVLNKLPLSTVTDDDIRDAATRCMRLIDLLDDDSSTVASPDRDRARQRVHAAAARLRWAHPS
mmetsp:Transcript_28806/g.78111  ORF Transcript_28806/g.78111 Transcript_28806/m.78111 type:complete len:300 (+) Transcript_28806:4158-5057(+)